MAPMNEHETEAATAFAAAIRSTPTWQQWDEARRSLEGDAALVDLFSRYQELSGKWQRAGARGSGLSGEQVVELAQVQEKIANHPLYVRRDETLRELTTLLQDLNSLLTEHLGIDFAAAAAPRSGCCG